MEITNNIDTYLTKHDSLVTVATLISFSAATTLLKRKEHPSVEGARAVSALDLNRNKLTIKS